MTGQLLLRGMIVGLIAGLLAFGFARVFGEPWVEAGIAFEEQEAKEAGTAAEPEMFSRATQSGPGLLTASVAYSVAIGGLFALTFAFAYGRIGHLSPRLTATVLSVAGFVSVIGAPFLKYPANPPGVGISETIGMRTEFFFVMIVASVAGMVLALMLARNLAARFGIWGGIGAAGLAYIAFIAVIQALLPSVNEVPENFSAAALWNFRAATLGMHVIVWGVLGLLFGWLAERLLIKQGAYRPVSLTR
jgi:hypothetical protein